MSKHRRVWVSVTAAGLRVVPNLKDDGAANMYGLRGSVAAMLFIAGVGAYSAITRTTNYEPAKGSVYLIDRKCSFVETTTDPDGRKTARGLTDSCNSTGDWDTVREKRNKTVAGTAVVHINYVAPQDGSSRTAKLEFTGRDDEFYELKAGDEIDVLVSNSDPATIVKA